MFSQAVKGVGRKSLEVFREEIKTVKSYGWSQKFIFSPSAAESAVASLLDTKSPLKMTGSLLGDSPRYSTIRKTIL